MTAVNAVIFLTINQQGTSFYGHILNLVGIIKVKPNSVREPT